jgi:hypothetical protein
MVPYDLTMAPVQSTGGQQRATARDTTGALLEAAFMLRTFVKSPVPADSLDGTE